MTATTYDVVDGIGFGAFGLFVVGVLARLAYERYQRHVSLDEREQRIAAKEKELGLVNLDRKNWALQTEWRRPKVGECYIGAGSHRISFTRTGDHPSDENIIIHNTIRRSDR